MGSFGLRNARQQGSTLCRPSQYAEPASKVRCSKEKPTCARCARRGVACIYMVSRRTGRTSSNACKVNAAQIWMGTSRLTIGSPGSVRITAGGDHHGSTGFSGGTHGGLATRDRLIGRRRPLYTGFPLESHINTHRTAQLTTTPETDIGPDIDVWNCISPSTLLADPAGSPPLTGHGNDVGDLFDLGFGSHMIMDRQESNSPETNDQTTVTTPDIFGDPSLSVLDRDFSATHSFALDWISPRRSSTNSNGNPAPPDCCLTTILNLLARLFPNATHGCTLSATGTLQNSSHHNGRTLESVISENKQTIETLTSLLDCHCSHDEYLLSLMTLVTLKVMGWYAAAAAAAAAATRSNNHNDGGSPVPPTPSPSTSPPPSYTQPHPHTNTHAQNHPLFTLPPSPHPPQLFPDTLAEHVLPTPAAAEATSVGAYCLTGPAAPPGPRLVLGELHRAGRLAQALAQRLEGVRTRAGAGGDWRRI
ncbi:aflatoxin regulatory protein-domain-containing protein [Chaetomium sp. MPI-CAGE-AT-0009]|nr:aflatoxin regulatory protein-domain-containing protein [Chaetomium sp. MPI-CAGE-AT-0009]